MSRKDTLVEALRLASKEVLLHNPETVDQSAKKNAGDILTAADLASEKVIVSKILEDFPDDVVVSEENEDNHGLVVDPSFTGWVVDPIDGTNNFSRGFNYFGISIGYIENGASVLGGVIDPNRDDLYLAEKGAGSTCNEIPIHVSLETEFSFSTRVGCSNSFDPGGKDANMDRMKNLGEIWVDVLGSFTLLVCDVARGRIDFCFHNMSKPWDNAACLLIASEAGATVTDLEGNPARWAEQEVVIGNRQLVEEFFRLQNI